MSCKLFLKKLLFSFIVSTLTRRRNRFSLHDRLKNLNANAFSVSVQVESVMPSFTQLC